MSDCSVEVEVVVGAATLDVTRLLVGTTAISHIEYPDLHFTHCPR